MTHQAMQKSLLAVCVGLLILSGSMLRAEVSRFFGNYKGSAQVVSADGTSRQRDMSVEIGPARDGFRVHWTSITYRVDGSSKEKSYTIEFVPSQRDGVFAAAMRRNVFGHDVQLDPMKGEPYVWGRIVGDTLSIYSLYVTEEGGYEMQQFDRTLTDGGLNLKFQIVHDGAVLRTVSTFLARQ